jgi:hypothetical protein
VRPEDGHAPILRLLQVAQLEHAGEHGLGNDVIAADVGDPVGRFDRGVVVEALDRIRRRVA